MTKPYAIFSDIHFHGWSAFGGKDKDGISTRLKIIMDEFERGARELEKEGGDTIILAGDVFHVRGSIDPEVLNPVHDMIRALLIQGFKIIAIPGNHDLKSKDTSELSNAFQAFAALDGFTVVTKPSFFLLNGETPLAMLPWVSSNDGARSEIENLQKHLVTAGRSIGDYDLVIHAGINGVMKGMPDHGLDAAEVAAWGFKRVFAGHYHNHKVMEGGKVVSIGALTHQTWGDVGTKAGFIIVHPDRIDWRASHAPHFVEVTDETPEEEVELIVPGNYVQVRGMKATDAEIKALRDGFEKLGAKGFLYRGVREVVSARTSSATHKATTLQESTAAWISEKKEWDDDHRAAVTKDALDILAEVTATAA